MDDDTKLAPEPRRLVRPTVYPTDTRFFVHVFGEWGRMKVKAWVVYRGEVEDRDASVEAWLTPKRLPRQRRHLRDGTMVMADMAGERRLVDFISWWKGAWEEDHFALSLRNDLDFVLEGIPRLQASGVNVEVDPVIADRDIMSPHPVHLSLEIVAIPGAFIATTRGVAGPEQVSDQELDRAMERGRRWVKIRGRVAYLSESTKLSPEVCKSLGQQGVTWENKDVLISMLRVVADAKVIEEERPILRRLLTTEDERQVPASVNATLRPYQIDGMAWIRRALASGMGGILADAMGLGKSLQTIAAYMAMRERDPKYKALILAPKSLMGNWRKEFEKFTRGVSVLVWDGPNRKRYESLLATCDVVICAYETFKRDRGLISEHAFHLLVCDEAQNLKNPDTASHQAVVNFPCGVQLALTGTPIENRLEDLHALFAFASKGLLPPLKVFRDTVVKPYKEGDPAAVEHMRDHVTPFILRRTKDEVLTDLPPKTIVDQLCPMTEKQDQFYKDSLNEARFQRDQAMATGDKGMMAALYLKLITRLRRIAVDPRLVDGGAGFTADDSGKILTLRAIMDELDADESNKCLIFSQWTDCLSVVRDELQDRKQPFSYLTGQTKDRDQQVQNFQEKAGIRYFLLGLKAGGVGLNITAANTVIMMDPWWNPATENQAYDRAHRMGQLRPVTVYRLIAEETIEEKIASLKAIKQAISDGVIDEQAIPEFNVDMMSGLLGLRLTRATRCATMLDMSYGIDRPVCPIDLAEWKFTTDAAGVPILVDKHGRVMARAPRGQTRGEFERELKLGLEMDLDQDHYPLASQPFRKKVQDAVDALRLLSYDLEKSLTDRDVAAERDKVEAVIKSLAGALLDENERNLARGVPITGYVGDEGEAPFRSALATAFKDAVGRDTMSHRGKASVDRTVESTEMCSFEGAARILMNVAAMKANLVRGDHVTREEGLDAIQRGEEPPARPILECEVKRKVVELALEWMEGDPAGREALRSKLIGTEEQPTDEVVEPIYLDAIVWDAMEHARLRGFFQSAREARVQAERSIHLVARKALSSYTMIPIGHEEKEAAVLRSEDGHTAIRRATLIASDIGASRMWRILMASLYGAAKAAGRDDLAAWLDQNTSADISANLLFNLKATLTTELTR